MTYMLFWMCQEVGYVDPRDRNRAYTETVAQNVMKAMLHDVMCPKLCIAIFSLVLYEGKYLLMLMQLHIKKITLF
jgi:hypothetical protein